MGIFIRVDVDLDVIRKTDGLAAKLVEICPVKIFATGSRPGSLGIVEENVDECTLCDLCTQASPDAVKVMKLYSQGS